MNTIIETVTTSTLLGIRCWDPVRDEPVRDGLSVAAWPAHGGGPRVEAARTASGVYAFHRVPGLRDREHGSNVVAGSPDVTVTLVVEIRDLRRRFLDTAFDVDVPLPYRGVLLAAEPWSPETSPPGVVLFSAPTRGRVPGFAVVAADLVDLDGGGPASHARVRARFPEGTVGHGIADSRGRITVLLPYPTFEDDIVGSPPPTVGTPLRSRSWDLEIEVFYEPARHRSLIHTEIPDYRGVLAQAAAEVWIDDPDLGAAASEVWVGRLSYGRETVLKTGGRSELVVRAPSSSP